MFRWLDHVDYGRPRWQLAAMARATRRRPFARKPAAGALGRQVGHLENGAAGKRTIVADHLGRSHIPHLGRGQGTEAARTVCRSKEREDPVAARRMERHTGKKPRNEWLGD